MQVPGSHAFPAWLKPRVFVRWEINFTVFPIVCKSFPHSNYMPGTKATITISKQSAYDVHAVSMRAISLAQRVLRKGVQALAVCCSLISAISPTTMAACPLHTSVVNHLFICGFT